MEELQEADVWGALDPIPDPIPEPSAPVKIQRSIKSALTAEILRSSSAPVNVPNWSKVQNEELPPKNKWWDEEDMNACNGEGNDGGEDNEGEWVPPHEVIARRDSRERSNRAAYSMCEGGVGRTLKGRDLINVRNTIWVRTGYLKREELIKVNPMKR